MDTFSLSCIACGKGYPGLEVRYRCDCGGTLDVSHDLKTLAGISVDTFDARLASRAPADVSGVWRFRELVLPIPTDALRTRREGNTNIYDSARVAAYAGLDRFPLKHEGENPTGSFKDRGMTVGISLAQRHGMEKVACASTGNTSASMAAYAAMAGMTAYVFIPEGNVAYGKLGQALAYGARTIQIAGDFDAAMKLVQEVCALEGVYLLNSLNPFRIEGQKTIGFELLQDLGWDVPDFIVMPGGNLGNCAAIGKGLRELRELGLIPRLPRLCVIQAEGANPLYRAFREERETLEPVKAETIATAIRIGNPVSWRRSLRELQVTNGVVEQVTDQELMDAKARIDSAGIGAEPASCVTLAGAKKLVACGIIPHDARVSGILTGHLLKDPDATVGYHRGGISGIRSTFANEAKKADATLSSVLAAMA